MRPLALVSVLATIKAKSLFLIYDSFIPVNHRIIRPLAQVTEMCYKDHYKYLDIKTINRNLVT